MIDPQLQASDPAVSAFVTANAGSGKTRTLVDRVARLLLRGAPPQAILCVTFTKAAAAEMQRRLFDTLGRWAVMPDDQLADALARIREEASDMPEARRLFARALETPGGLKIQTIHAFCDVLLRRFPLEAGVAPGFTVIDDQAAAALSQQARELVATVAAGDEDGPLGAAYARLAADLDFRTFTSMFSLFEGDRRALTAWLETQGGDLESDTWRRCGFEAVTSVAAIEHEALAGVDWPALGEAAQALLGGSPKDAERGTRLLALADRQAAGGEAGFAELWAPLAKKEGDPLKSVATKAVDAAAAAWLADFQASLAEACERRKAALVAEDTVAALTLAFAYIGVYEDLKTRHGGLDFGDLIERVRDLLTVRSDAAWVLFKLDGGVDHILLDEAQDTSPGQWAIIDALAEEFFAGAGVRPAVSRTAFAVGDEKQSIFSFQGARPELFIGKRADYKNRIEAAAGRFRAPELLTSYRSVPEVLAFVDQVFRDPEALAGLRPEGPEAAHEIRHVAVRPAGFGAVEIWPLEVGDKAEEQDPWAPVDMPSPESAHKRLAARIAAWIKAAIARGDAVCDKETGLPRPAGPADFLILVRRRNVLFHEIIRALKKAGVAVGGADRLKLTDHIAYMDLLALARFVLFPGDDLNLAALLRSPLFDVDEDSLYALAQPRNGAALWGELERRRHEQPRWAEAHALLAWSLGQTGGCAPFDFYGRLLSRPGPDGRSMRARMLTRLGAEAEDALDAFMAEALKAEARGSHDFESFAAEMAASEIEVKREQEDGKGYVRVMTAHGSKGLEAPIVILPDTTGLPPAGGAPLLKTADGGYLWCSSTAGDCPASAQAREVRNAATLQESLRLLYVGLTRARDRLIVTGMAVGNATDGFRAGSWWDFVNRAAASDGQDFAAVTLSEADRDIIRIGAPPRPAPADAAGAPVAPVAPAWAGRPPGPERADAAWASPSRLADEASVPAPSPLAVIAGLGRYRRGDLVHKLLQLLPDIAPGDRHAAAVRMLGRERDLIDDQRAEIIAAVFGVLDDPRFAAVFGPGSRAEVAIAGGASGLPAGLKVSGRLDRLVVSGDRVLVVDYKSNRPSPDRIEDADPAYIRQMAIYAAVLADIFPGRAVEAALVWTDGPKLTVVPESLIAGTLAALRKDG